MNLNLHYAWERAQTSPPVQPPPSPEGLRAYADVLRAQEEAVNGAARRASEDEARVAARRALRRRRISSPAVQYYAGAQCIALALGLHAGLWVWFLVVGIALGVGALFSMMGVS